MKAAGGAIGSRWQMTADLFRLMSTADRWYAAGVTAMSLALAGTAAAIGLSQRWLVDSAGQHVIVGLIVAVALGAVSYTLTAACGRIESNLRLYLIERSGILLNRQVVAWSARVPTVEHLDDPAFLDRSALLRQNSIYLADGLSATSELTSVAFGILLSAWLLVDIHPALGLLMLLAIPPVLANSAGQRRVRGARERAIGSVRLEQRLHELVVRPEPAKEVLVSDAQSLLQVRAAGLWRDAWVTEAKANLLAAVWQLLGWMVYLGGMIASLLIVSRQVVRGQASLGDATLVLFLGTQLLAQINTAIVAAFRMSRVGNVATYYGALRERAHRPNPGDQPAPSALRHGITMRDVSFSYGDGSHLALRNVDVHLPAGATVAVVGANGAGKSTFVKLLSGMYQPRSGRVEVDGVPLDQLDPASWRSRLTAAFQDAVRFQVRVEDAIRIGDLRQLDRRVVVAAAERAGVTKIIENLPDGYQTQLGVAHGGVDLSGGQWQRLALARACMRPDPLLLLLDEPTAAMDPDAEHTLFEQFMRLADEAAKRSGTITVLVTHRYSTVRDVDLVIVLDGGRVTELGRHDELMARGGRYARLYNLQAKGYR
ncbi:ABC transporter ATP-binding protein [Plantactinospora sp. CA-290183]|uniref:ABC transporter ATP-binding protein n=1 Tax=Plantactinospora sp. CA-290183 TaxID=3240006 RepID=UPI003D913187